MGSQPMEALALAQRARRERSRVRAAITAGDADAVKLIHEPPACVEKVAVRDFLTWLPGIGAKRARKMLKGVVLSDDLPLGKLSPHTRLRVARALEERAARLATA